MVVSHRAGVYVSCCSKVSCDLPLLTFSYGCWIALWAKRRPSVEVLPVHSLYPRQDFQTTSSWYTMVTVLLRALAKCLEDLGVSWHPRGVVWMVLRCEDILLHSPIQLGQVEFFSHGRQSTKEKETDCKYPCCLEGYVSLDKG